MTDLLVSSLMAGGGLESALSAALKVEAQDLDDATEKEGDLDKPTESGTLEKSHEDLLMTEQAQMEAETKRTQEAASVASRMFGRSDQNGSSIPLLHLVKQLLKNISAQTANMLQEEVLLNAGSDIPNFSNLPQGSAQAPNRPAWHRHPTSSST